MSADNFLRYTFQCACRDVSKWTESESSLMPISSEGNGWARLFVYFRLKFHPYFSCFFFILYDTEILIFCQNKKLFTVLVKDFLTPCIFTSIDFQVINVFSSTLCLYFEEFICVLCLHPLPHPFPCSTPPASQLPLMSSFFIFYCILCVYVYAQIYIQASGCI